MARGTAVEATQLLTRHKIGIASSPQNPALVMFYTQGTSGLRKRVMPVRGLEAGVEAAAHRLVSAHAPLLDPEAVSFDQVLALCTKLQCRLSAQPPPPTTGQEPASLDRSLLHDIADDLPSPNLETGAGSDAEADAALAAFARGRLEASTFAMAGDCTPSASSSAGSEERPRRPTTVTVAVAKTKAKAKSEKTTKGEGKSEKKGEGKAKAKKPKTKKPKAGKPAKGAGDSIGGGEPDFAGLEALLGMSSEDEDMPMPLPVSQSAKGAAGGASGGVASGGSQLSPGSRRCSA